MLIVGSFLLVGFVIWERICPNPLIPLHIWKDMGFSFLMPVSIFGITAMLSSNLWLALFLQEVHHRSALAVAVQLLPQVISAIISNIVAANILHRVNNSLIMAFGAAMYLMYVMQLLPSQQQSLAGGIFNMFIRLGATIIFGMSTAVYSSVKTAQEGKNDASSLSRAHFMFL
ncbi:hypothetical protein M441DRAFT_450212 [Trichoderma asperellum CBS 433.97]|uniref:Major facilitator superfamily (MFS) profile domain-containing protein n=1 Tax=Trichoderma asperellum (strain ATCC 204424 / CBS 433.97 / NBRC 101777) TaxID=1042311 RepID=A0A2T3YTB4_TRIA4|nr:hypothetical protein M441DRAFT_450212 [Trichoderma asperellum CBS 433.97]PTB35744.1 hypothetical protein M441DRAFT_450212 [Trichoderma asperellum CBS 433.97]